jgi:hypothetical protein
MSPTPIPHAMILRAHLEAMPSPVIGDDIWHEVLGEAIRWEAEPTIEHIAPRLLQLLGRDRGVEKLVGDDRRAAPCRRSL